MRSLDCLLLCGALAACHGTGGETTPHGAPAQLTPDMLGKINDDMPIEWFVDPSAGLITVEMEEGKPQTDHLCGPKLAARAAELDIQIPFEVGAEPVSCDDTKCSWPLDNGTAALVFRKGPRGVVVHAFVHGIGLEPPELAGVIASLPVDQACGKGAALVAPPTWPAPATPPDPKLLENLATGTRPLSSFVNKKRGLLVYDDFIGPGEAEDESRPKPNHDPQKLCGAALEHELPGLEKTISQRLKEKMGEEGGHLGACRTARGLVECGFGGNMEWDPAYHLHFHNDAARGLILDAVTIADEAAVPQHARLKSVIKRKIAVRQFREHPCQ